MQNSFFLVLVATVFASMLLPSLGAWLGSYSFLTTVTIALMYVGLGMNTSTSALKKGISNWKSVASVQFCLFVIAPLISVITYQLCIPFSSAEAMVGIIFVGAIPTTITSCIVLTDHYGGNTVTALYSSILSQFLGILISPLIISVFLAAHMQGVSSFATVCKSLLIKVVLPFIIGQFLQNTPGGFKKTMKKTSFYGIFFILYMHLANIVASGQFATMAKTLAIPFVLVIMIAVIQTFSTQLVGSIVPMTREDRIALLFTGSQKTLGMGVPLATVYFAQNPAVQTYATVLIIVNYVATMIIPSLYVHTLQTERGDKSCLLF